MHCSQARRLLQLYIDRRQPLEQLRALELHLATCPACMRQFQLLERIEQSFASLGTVAEPDDLTENIMRRVAYTPQRVERPTFSPFRPSLAELAAAVLMATIVTLGFMLGQPSLREMLPIANGHDAFSIMLIDLMHSLSAMNSDTLMLGFWIVGTLLGIWIAMALAGNEMRRLEWFKSVMDRLPVW